MEIAMEKMFEILVLILFNLPTIKGNTRFLFLCYPKKSGGSWGYTTVPE